MRGTIKLVKEQGYGFIEPEDGGQDIFFHASTLNEITFNELKTNMPVEFDTEQGQKGLKAINIRPE